MKEVIVNDLMQQDYKYYLVKPMGEEFDKDFTPDLTPKEMLELGVFGGKYLTDCLDEFPADWFTNAKLSPQKKDRKLNWFNTHASQSLELWRKNGWIYKDDPRGWFQWYCRYYMGRRLEHEDRRQIRRWYAFRRHRVAVRRHCEIGDYHCHRRRRQALLHWAYDSRQF